jgi:hypothetical protein
MKIKFHLSCVCVGEYEIKADTLEHAVGVLEMQVTQEHPPPDAIVTYVRLEDAKVCMDGAENWAFVRPLPRLEWDVETVNLRAHNVEWENEAPSLVYDEK